MDERLVPVTLHAPPNDLGTIGGTGTIADTPENRALLEQAAIPRCREWREANPEPWLWCDSPDMTEEQRAWCQKAHAHPSKADRAAPYCCSAYCDRCAGLRALDGAKPLLPNEWMNP